MSGATHDFRPLRPAELRAYRRLNEALPLLDAAIDGADFNEAPDASGDGHHQRIESLDEAIDVLSRVIADSVIDAPASDVDLRAAMDDLDAAAGDVRRCLDPRDERTIRSVAFRELEGGPDAEYIVRRAALEDHGATFAARAGADGVVGVTFERLDDATVDNKLVEYVYERAAALMTVDVLPWLEARACRWYFDRASAVLEEQDPGLRRLRAKELFLLDRPSIVFMRPVLRAFLDRSTALDFSPRQFRLAEALTASVPGVFAQITPTGPELTVERLGDGRIFRLAAPPNHGAGAGSLILGRLMPRDEAFVVAPGFLSLPVLPVEPFERVANDLIAGTPPNYATVVMEAMRTAIGEVALPVPVHAATSPNEAVMLLDILEGMAEDGELLRWDTESLLSFDVGDPRAPTDEILAMWWSALARDAAAPSNEDGTRWIDPEGMADL
jgi:hypothetical protein